MEDLSIDITLVLQNVAKIYSDSPATKNAGIMEIQ
jgi:hypothetical protein